MSRSHSRCAWITAKRIHGLLTVFWLVMAVPSVVWWKNSVPYLVFVSVYALVCTHWSAFQGAKAEEAANS